MFWLALPIVGLRDPDNLFCLTVGLLAVTLQLAAQVLYLSFSNAHVVYGPLPSGVPPALEILIDPLACRSIQA